MMIRRRISTVVASLGAWLLWGTLTPVSAQQPVKDSPRQLRAGAATSNITPALGAIIVGGWGKPEAEHIHDELHARCLVLDDGETQLGFVICDNVGILREVFDLAKRLAERETGIPASHLMMSATHTHSGPSARGSSALLPTESFTDYQQFLARRIADGLRRAQKNLEPARVGWGSGQLPGQVFNRRWYLQPGVPNPNPFGGTDTVKMNPGSGKHLLKPAGPVDPEISFLSVQAADGRPLALLANYSLHYVGGVRPNEISADYFAMFAERIAELLHAEKQDPPFVGIMSNGTSGDVNNNYLTPEVDPNRKPVRYPPYGKMRVVANEAAEVVHKALENTQYHTEVTLAAAETEIPIRVRKPDEKMLAWASEVLARPADAPLNHPRERTYAERVTQMADWPEQIPMILQAFRIGDLGIAAIPFEVFTETGLEIKDRGPLKRTFTISLANGAYGYLPTRSQHKLGGYETWLGTNRVEVEAAHKMTDTLIEMLNRLEKEATAESK